MNWLRWFSGALLFLNGSAACLGGFSFVTDPSGQKMQIPIFWLEHSPFGNYFIPGFILLVVIGFGSVAVGTAAILKAKSYPILITMMGGVIAIWIIVQMLMLRIVYFLHLVIGGIGITLMVLGIIQWQMMDSWKKA